MSALKPLVAIVVFASLIAACRNADKNAASGSVLPIPPSIEGANGCSGPDQTFTVGQTPVLLTFPGFTATSSSHITAARGSEVLYATGASGTIVAIDVTTTVPNATTLVSSAAVVALLDGANINVPPDLSGIAVLDASTLVVVDRTSNTILAVDRTLPDTIAFFAGQPNTVPGFADGPATGTSGLARFSFAAPTMLCPTADGRVFVADAGNDAIRFVRSGLVITAAGRGTPGFADGDLSTALFDTPSGVSVLCNLSLLVTEQGGSGFGQRLRLVSIGAENPVFGGFSGATATLAGTGVSGTTQGAASVVEVATPLAPFVTGGGEVYWIDAETGVFRRFRTDGQCDCPLAADCASAVATPTFTAGHSFSMTGTDGGQLFVLDATDGKLYRVTP